MVKYSLFCCHQTIVYQLFSCQEGGLNFGGNAINTPLHGPILYALEFLAVNNLLYYVTHRPPYCYGDALPQGHYRGTGQDRITLQINLKICVDYREDVSIAALEI